MTLPCEVSSRYVVPALRFLIARKLIYEHDVTQSEAAKLLGVSQPSISHYLNSKRGARVARALVRSRKIRRFVDRYVERLLEKRAPPRDMPFCEICGPAVKLVFRERVRTRRRRALAR